MLPLVLPRPKSPVPEIAKILDLYGERDGTRTHDHLIKSQVLYQLSYALLFRLCRGAGLPGQ